MENKEIDREVSEKIRHLGLIPVPDFDDGRIDWDAHSRELFFKLYKEFPMMTDRVMKGGFCDIDPDFLGFVGTYYLLSFLIPKSWTVIKPVVASSDVP